MIIQIKQTHHFQENTYEITKNEEPFLKGQTPLILESGDIQLCMSDGEVLLQSRNCVESVGAVLGIKGLFQPIESKIHEFYFPISGERGKIYLRSYRVLEQAYCMEFQNAQYVAYRLLKGRAEAILVYRRDDKRQIAHIERKTVTADMKDDYMMYLSDEFQSVAEVMCLFILYYDHYNHGDRGEVSAGIKMEASWSYSAANELYDPDWMKTNFPEVSAKPISISAKSNRRTKYMLIIGIALVPIVFASMTIYAIANGQGFDALIGLLLIIGIPIFKWLARKSREVGKGK